MGRRGGNVDDPSPRPPKNSGELSTRNRIASGADTTWVLVIFMPLTGLLGCNRVTPRVIPSLEPVTGFTR